MIDKWNGYKNALRDMLTKATGTVDMEDGTGAVVTLPTFPALKKNVQDMLDSGTGAVAAAQASASAAAGSASDSNGYAQESLQHANDAAASSATAESHAAEASISASAAAGSSTEAADSAEIASTSASTAEALKTDSAASAASALASQVAAASSESAAAGSASDASSSAAEAHAWALSAQTTVTGLLHYVPGGWDASSGTFPSNPNTGDFYKITVAGTVGGEDLQVGDQIIYSGSGWDHIDNTESVTAVAGKIGNVSLAVADITGLPDALDAKASLTGADFTGEVVVHDRSLRVSGWGGTETDGVVYFGSGDSYIYKQGVNFLIKNGQGGWQATLDSGGTIWTSGSLDKSKLQTDGTQRENRFTRDVLQSTTLKSGIFANDGQGLLNAAGTATSVGGWWHVINMYHDSDGYGAQIAVELSATGTNAMLLRSSSGTNWREWNTVWHNGNFNPGNYAQLSGAAFTGAATFANGVTVAQVSAFYMGSAQLVWDSGFRFNDNVRVGNTLFQIAANSSAWIRTPRTFVQAGDPGAQASDGDLWIW